MFLDLPEAAAFIDDMAWPYPLHSRNAVDRAGEVLLNNEEWNQYLLWDDLDAALEIINNWRSSHAYPLNALKITLKQRAKEVDSAALVAQRLKRIEAIKMKMERGRESGRTFGLSTMQDLGGCRAVMRTVSGVEALQEVYHRADKRNPDRGSYLAKPFDYIKRPKDDGYRGIHLVYKYRSQTHKKGSKIGPGVDRARYDGLKIEIQLRSVLQHQWATAVETAGRYTRQNIKGAAGEAKWARFFSLTSNAIAMIEKRPLVPKTPDNKSDLVKAILKHRQQIDLLKTYTAPRVIVPGKSGKDADTYILLVDPLSKQIEARPFQRGRHADAQKAYFTTERTIRNQEGVEAVLVGVDSAEQLKVAYPSYYMDARDFVKTIESFIS